MIILNEESTREEKIEALFKYKEGEEIGMYMPLPNHVNLDVLVTSKMGYYDTMGNLRGIIKEEHKTMIHKLINTINHGMLYRNHKLNLDDFPSNLLKKVSVEVQPFLNNKWIDGSFDLIHVNTDVYADRKRKEFISVVTGKRQSIFDGEYLTVGGRVSVIEWFNAVDRSFIIIDNELVRITSFIKEKYGKDIPYKYIGKTLILSNGDKIRLTNRGTISEKCKDMKWITS